MGGRPARRKCGNTNVDLFIRETHNALAPNIADVTWSPPARVTVGGGAIPGDQFFPWIEMTPDGRLHLVFMDSRHNPDQLDENNGGDEHGLFDVYYAHSEDDGQTWTPHRLTEQSFDTANGQISFPDRDFFGDYLGLSVAGKRVYPFYPVAVPADGTIPAQALPYTNVVIFGDYASLDDLAVPIGTIEAGDVDSLAAADDGDRLEVCSAPGLTPTVHLTDARVGLTAPYANSPEIDLRLRTSADTANLDGVMRLKNWITGDWDLVKTFDVSTIDADIVVRGIRAGSYVRASDKRVEVRIEHSGTPIGAQGFLSRHDQVEVIGLEE